MKIVVKEDKKDNNSNQRIAHRNASSSSTNPSSSSSGSSRNASLITRVPVTWNSVLPRHPSVPQSQVYDNSNGVGNGFEGDLPPYSTNRAPPSSSSSSSSQRKRRIDGTTSHPADDTSATSGYNSGDERSSNSVVTQQSVINALQREKDLMEVIANKGFTINRMAADGNCLFRAIADQVFGDPEMHELVRKQICDHLQADRDHFSQFVLEDFDQYVARKRQNMCFGNNLEIQACADVYCRPVELYQSGPEPLNLFQGSTSTSNAPIRLSYHLNNHYNSVIDPNNPSVGIGLGLPGLNHGLPVDAMVREKVMKETEQEDIDKALLLSVQSDSSAMDAENMLLQTALEQSLPPEFHVTHRPIERDDDNDEEIQKAILLSTENNLDEEDQLLQSAIEQSLLESSR